jgi:hypothetical protein
MDLGTYFTTLEFVLMTATFVVLALVFLYAYFGEEESKED